MHYPMTIFVCQVFHFNSERQPAIRGSSGAEDDLRWKMTFDGRRPLMEDDLQWKTTFDRRQPLMEDNL